MSPLGARHRDLLVDDAEPAVTAAILGIVRSVSPAGGDPVPPERIRMMVRLRLGAYLNARSDDERAANACSDRLTWDVLELLEPVLPGGAPLLEFCGRLHAAVRRHLEVPAGR